MPVVRGDVQEAIRRLLDRLHHRRMAVAGAAHRDAGGKIQEAIAIDVPHLGALPWDITKG